LGGKEEGGGRAGLSLPSLLASKKRKKKKKKKEKKKKKKQKKQKKNTREREGGTFGVTMISEKERRRRKGKSGFYYLYPQSNSKDWGKKKKEEGYARPMTDQLKRGGEENCVIFRGKGLRFLAKRGGEKGGGEGKEKDRSQIFRFYCLFAPRRPVE